jgi:hypothetical protein
MQPRPAVSIRSLLRDDGGEVFIEYLVVLSILFLALSQTIAAMGPGIVQNYQSQRAVLLSINP